ncbi:MAG: type II toxin-antitoxin system VapC family toxin [Spirochaetaceae bacterium]|jgi:PIN domain nuclease of toxin-antitoxin system|nr:type II toxin-antitoxin system VapC family toxin [Spirochaetaceae bacterium]
MGRYLLDTHTAIWFLIGVDDKLSAAARRIIGSDSRPVYLSVVSGWEMAIKINIGKLRFPGNAAGFIRSAQAWEITILPIETAHLTALESLPLIHRDPFDRLLVATALAEKMTLVSADENIRRYDVDLVW